MAQGDAAKAKRVFEKALAKSSHANDVTRLHHIGVGRAHEAMGEHERALEAYGRAEAIVDELARLVLVQQGRTLQLASLEQSSRLVVDLAACLGRLPLAERVARRARVRSWSALSLQRSLGDLPPDERRRIDAKAEAYLRARMQMQASMDAEWVADGKAMQRRRLERERREAELRARLAAVLAELNEGELASQDILRLDGADDVVVFPGRTDWWAVLARAGGNRATRLGPLHEVSELSERLAEFVLSSPGEVAGRVRLMP